jgi:hypothetical protein
MRQHAYYMGRYWDEYLLAIYKPDADAVVGDRSEGPVSQQRGQSS